MFEFIEKIIYINLEHRVDRKEETLRQLSKYFPEDKILRFNAIPHMRGNVGCSQSHNAALRMARSNQWKNVLIVEDDASWDSDFSKEYTILEELVRRPYDVICLGVIGISDEKTHKLLRGQSRTAYLVAQHYYDRLISHQEEGLDKLLSNDDTRETRDKYCGDQYWKLLQKIDNWYRVRLMYQLKGYSDICKIDVDYEHMFRKW